MFELLKTLFRPTQPIAPPPQHIDVSAEGDTLSECLYNLEKEAGLQRGDLSVSGEPRNVATFFGHRGKSHNIRSQTRSEWERDGIPGYIAGDVFEVTQQPNVEREQVLRTTLIGAYTLAIASEVKFFGKLHISKNCPGVFSNNRCTTCGALLRD